jgi:hypothetical protein
MEIHWWSQLAYSCPNGHIVVAPDEGEEVSQGIGSHTDAGYTLTDDLRLNIRASILFADTETNEIAISAACQQIRNWLRLNRQITTGGQTTQRAGKVTFKYGFEGERGQPGHKRICQVNVTYRKPVAAAT